MNNSKRKLDEMQILKGFAVILVVLVHSPQMIDGINMVIEQITRLGRWGCQLYFVISGFLITLSWESENPSLKKYYTNRVVTIVPAYYIAIAGYLSFNKLLNRYTSIGFFYNIKSDWVSILSNVLLLHGLNRNAFNFVVPGGWYIGTQWIFYLIFPALMSFYIKVSSMNPKYRKCIPIGILSVSFLVQFVIALVHGNPELSNLSSFLHYSALNQLPCFVIGINLFYEYDEDGFGKYTVRSTLFFLLVLGFIASFMFYVLRLIPLIYVFVPVIYAYAFAYLIVFVFKTYHLWSDTMLARFLYEWGAVSYAAYYTNFIFAMLIPWLIAKYVCEPVDGTILYAIFLIPIYMGTYVGAKLISHLMDGCTKILKKAAYDKLNIEEGGK